MIRKILSKFTTLGHLLLLKEFISIKDILSLRKMDRYKPGKVKTHLGDIEYVDSISFLSGIEEIFLDEIYKVKSYRVEVPVVIDCGANIGLSAIYFSEVYGAEVHAYEADPNIYQVLKRNVSNICSNGKVEANNFAVWVDDQGVTFDIEGGYSGQIQQHGHQLVKESVQIPSIALKEILSGMKNANFLKLDIEGAENQALLECHGLLRTLDFIFIEWHSITLGPQYLGEILNLLKAEGFRYHIKEAFTSAHPFVEIETICGMDIQLNIFAYK